MYPFAPLAQKVLRELHCMTCICICYVSTCTISTKSAVRAALYKLCTNGLEYSEPCIIGLEYAKLCFKGLKYAL
jgi:hypothetical protein